jgi:hypothetical protein
MEAEEYEKPTFIPNINEVMTKPEQAAAIFDYLISLLKVSTNAKTLAKQKQTAKDSLAKHFPELASYI